MDVKNGLLSSVRRALADVPDKKLVVDLGLLSIFGGLIDQIAEPGGAERLLLEIGEIDDTQTLVAAEILASEPPVHILSKGAAILINLFGTNQSFVVSTLARSAEMDNPAVVKLLSLVATVSFHCIAQHLKAKSSFTAEALGEALMADRPQVVAQLPGDLVTTLGLRDGAVDGADVHVTDIPVAQGYGGTTDGREKKSGNTTTILTVLGLGVLAWLIWPDTQVADNSTAEPASVPGSSAEPNPNQITGSDPHSPDTTPAPVQSFADIRSNLSGVFIHATSMVSRVQDVATAEIARGALDNARAVLISIDRFSLSSAELEELQPMLESIATSLQAGLTQAYEVADVQPVLADIADKLLAELQSFTEN